MSATREDRMRGAMERLTQLDEDTGCLEWHGTVTGGSRDGTPTFDGVSVRRLLLRMEGKEPRPGEIVTVNCGNPKCVEREHFVVRARKTQAKINGKKSWSPQSRAAHLAAVILNVRSNSKVKTPEMAAAVRAAATAEEGAAIAGIAVSTAKRIRAGETWRRSLPGSSVFVPGSL